MNKTNTEFVDKIPEGQKELYLTEEETTYFNKTSKVYIYLACLVAPIASIIVFILKLIDINKWIIFAFIMLSALIQVLVIYLLKKFLKQMEIQT
jgi:hypothetical protein